MREIMERLPDLARKGERAAYCTVVDTSGSTPQKPGAKLLILPSFRNIGTLGGGCVEAEARKQAARLMQEGVRKLLDFRLDSDYGWDDGLICGGSMRIFIDLTDRAEDAAIFTRLNELIAEDVAVALATVVDVKDATEGVVVGNKLLLGTDGTRLGTLGTADLDADVRPIAVDALEENSPQMWRTPDDSVEVFVEGMVPQIRLIICGAGHVGAALTRFAAMCDFHVTVIDDRGEYANAQNLPDAHEIIVAEIPEALNGMELGPMAFVVIVTRGHRHDEQCLAVVAKSDPGYLGMIGSRRKIKLIMDDLADEGISAERLSRVRAPIGIEIASKTVPEIAVSILAELIQQRNARKATGAAAAIGH
jgi:xanthine dehydrogenase accessory factor